MERTRLSKAVVLKPIGYEVDQRSPSLSPTLPCFLPPSLAPPPRIALPPFLSPSLLQPPAFFEQSPFHPPPSLNERLSFYFLPPYPLLSIVKNLILHPFPLLFLPFPVLCLPLRWRQWRRSITPTSSACWAAALRWLQTAISRSKSSCLSLCQMAILQNSWRRVSE